MNNERMIWGILAVSSMLFPIIGMIIGLFRYRKQGERIRKEIKQDYSNAQKAGGVKSLYYKHEHKRVFAKTFGVPMVIGFLIGLMLMILAFSKL